MIPPQIQFCAVALLPVGLFRQPSEQICPQIVTKYINGGFYGAIIGCTAQRAINPMGCYWRARRMMGLGIAILFMAGGSAGCQPSDHLTSRVGLSQIPADTCSGSESAVESFDYAAQRERNRDIRTTRAVLEGLLSNCDGAVRTKALEWLVRLPRSSAPQSVPIPNELTVLVPCPGLAAWKERFEHEEAFRNAGDVTAALTLLQNALGDCDATVRQQAADRLKSLPSPPVTTTPAICPGTAVWRQRFDYAETLEKDGDIATARAMLVAGLADCDADVRKITLTRLQLSPYSPPKSPASGLPLPYCPPTETWKERFVYIDQLEIWGDTVSARLILGTALGDCNGSVRADALQRLVRMRPVPPATCVGWTAWRQRFEYSLRLKNSGNIADARALLMPALADCDEKVREGALKALGKMVEAGPRPVLFWRVLRAQTGIWFDTIAKVLALLLLALLAFLLCRAISLAIYRKQLLIQPLNVAGEGFEGDQFVTIATHVSIQMDALRWTGAPGQNTGRANLATGNVAEQAAQVSVAEAFAGDGAGKVVAALLSFVRQPRYLCSGTLYIARGEAQVLLQLNRRSTFWPHLSLVDHWEHLFPVAELMDGLKQLAYEMLLATAQSITGEENA